MCGSEHYQKTSKSIALEDVPSLGEVKKIQMAGSLGSLKTGRDKSGSLGQGGDNRVMW